MCFFGLHDEAARATCLLLLLLPSLGPSAFFLVPSRYPFSLKRIGGPLARPYICYISQYWGAGALLDTRHGTISCVWAPVAAGNRVSVQPNSRGWLGVPGSGLREGPFGGRLLLQGIFVGVARGGLEAVDGVFG